jgi:hypothetical protein
MNTQTPLIWNMGVFTPDQRQHHIEATTHLIQAIESVQEVEHGYQFTFPNETEFISKIAEFISNERLCCSFLDFSLNVTNGRPLFLSLLGPAGTQEFLRLEFSGAFE